MGLQCSQKYSRLRCLLHVKGLVICFYFGWSGSILQFRQKNSHGYLLQGWDWLPLAKLLDNLEIDYLIRENDDINKDSSNMDRNSTNNNGTVQPNWIIVQVALCGPVYQEDIPNWVLILTTKIQVNLKTFNTNYYFESFKTFNINWKDSS